MLRGEAGMGEGVSSDISHSCRECVTSLGSLPVVCMGACEHIVSIQRAACRINYTRDGDFWDKEET